MPRRARSIQGGLVCHILNRANARMKIFEKDDDYAAFERVLEEAHAREDLRILAYCVMPNHWHMVVWPKRGADKQVSEFFRWLSNERLPSPLIRHGGNGRQAAKLLVRVFGDVDLVDPYDEHQGIDLDALAAGFVKKFKEQKAAAKEAGIDYTMVPCLGHPVFNTEKINHDPREQVIQAYMKERGLYNIFLDG